MVLHLPVTGILQDPQLKKVHMDYQGTHALPLTSDKEVFSQSTWKTWPIALSFLLLERDLWHHEEGG